MSINLLYIKSFFCGYSDVLELHYSWYIILFESQVWWPGIGSSGRGASKWGVGVMKYTGFTIARVGVTHDRLVYLVKVD